MYYLIGISLLFTTLFTINLASSLGVVGAWRVLRRFVTEWPPVRTAAVIFALRVIPVAAALLFVLGFVLPAFLLFEPYHSDETVGLKLTLVVALAAFGIAVAMFRIFGSWWRTRRLVTDWLDSSEPADIDGVSMPAYRLRHKFPVFAIVGIFRPRMFIAEQLLDALDENELSAVITHELGHVAALDNLKRVLMRLCGDLLVLPVGRLLDRQWADASEIAADEFAVRQGGHGSALELASALIKIARIIPAGPLPAMPSAAFAVENPGDALACRIRRLLQMAETHSDRFEAGSFNPSVFALTVAAAFLLIVTLAFDLMVLAKVHNLSETLLSALK
jgi:Zn-dependent protease with chaperone function